MPFGRAGRGRAAGGSTDVVGIWQSGVPATVGIRFWQRHAAALGTRREESTPRLTPVFSPLKVLIRCDVIERVGMQECGWEAGESD
jgi:hypothetical protein